MVLKLPRPQYLKICKFENDVEMYGAQTRWQNRCWRHLFENDVEMYGAQTDIQLNDAFTKFENDVEMYGAQTILE